MVSIESPNTISTSTPASQLSKIPYTFEIRQYQPEDHEQVAKLVSDGLLHYAQVGDPHHDFWRSYVKKALATDVADIPGHYLNEGSTFFVVTATATEASIGESTARTIIATTAVMKKSESVAELKRVSVKAEFRRFGIGRILLHHVHEWAKAHEPKYEKLILSCASTQLQAIKFYQSLEYNITKTSVRLLDPYLELTHFEKCIEANRNK